MSIQPWESEHELTCNAAASLIRSQFPEVDTTVVRHLGSGWEFDAFVTGDEWVFRFPRRGECERLFNAEKAVHSLIVPLMPSGVAIPQVLLLGEPALGFPYHFAGHRLVKGHTADTVPDVLLPTLGRDIAAFLGVLHAIPERVARAAGVVEQDPDDLSRNEGVELGLEAAVQLRGLDPAADRAVRWLETRRLPIRPSYRPPQLIHQDLGPDHLIVDQQGHLSGVLDWTDATLGHAARDFVFLVTWRGWRFADYVIRHYPLPLDRTFQEQLEFMSRFLSVMWLATAYRRGADLSEGVQGVRNVFAAVERTQ